MGERIERVSPSETTNPQITVRRLQGTMAASGILLVLATWTLWTPNMVFPQVPLFHGAGGVPAWFEWLTFGLMVAALLAAMGVGRTQRWSSQALLGFVVVTAILIVIDQHRLQPWAYQFIILAIVFALATPSKALVLIRLLVVSIYVYSAVSKLDYSFLHTHGQRFLLILCQSVGLSIDQWPCERLLIMTALFPITELVVGIALGLKRSRCWGLWGSLLLHGLLLVTLGPWGFGHKPGVLIWNVYFMIQNVLLFGPIFGSRPGKVRAQQQPPAAIPSERLPVATGIGDGVAKVTLAAVVLLPLLEPFGWWDRWPAWAVYAAGAQRYRIYVHESGRQRLPQDLVQYVEPPRFVKLGQCCGGQRLGDAADAKPRMRPDGHAGLQV